MIDERWLLAARGLTVTFLTASARRNLPILASPFDPLQPRTWHDLAHCLGESTPSLVLGCAWMAEAVVGPLTDLEKVCSATHVAAREAWPSPLAGKFRAQSALTPHDTALSDALERAGATAPLLSPEETLIHAQYVLAPELATSRIKWMKLEPGDEEDGALIGAALTDLLHAEWALWGSGKDDAARRVGLARATVGALVGTIWSRVPTIPETSARAAAGALVVLAS